MTTGSGEGTCAHERARCLRCGSSGCGASSCDGQAFRFGMCLQCGQIERVPLTAEASDASRPEPGVAPFEGGP